MLGRNQALEQVFISKPWSLEPPETWLTTHIYTSDQALEEYKKMITDKETLILKLTDDERARMIERNQYLMEQRDKYVEELINKN